jgi:hypothetical protein
VYYLTPETDEDYAPMVENPYGVWGHEIELTAEQYADLERVRTEWYAWQVRLERG